MAIVIPPSLIAGAKTAGAVALEIVPIAAVAAGLTGLFKVFEKKPTAWEKTVKVAEQVATVGGVVKVGFEIFDGIYSRMNPEAAAANKKAATDHSDNPAILLMERMDRRHEEELDSRVQTAVAEALAAYEARQATPPPEVQVEVLQRPTKGKHLTRNRPKTAAGK